MAAIEESGERVLHRRVHREVGIRDHFEPFESGAPQLLRPAGNQPRRFHLRQATDFRDAAHSKCQRGGVCGETRWHGFVQHEIKKHFVGDDRDIAVRADLVQSRNFGGLGKMHDHGARANRDRVFQSVKINLPAMVVKQRVWNDFHVVNAGEKREKRIARFGNQDFIAGIAERAENEGIGFAGAGR